MMGSKARVGLAVGLLTLFVVASSVQGQDSSTREEVVAAYRKAEALKKEGKLREAAQHYERAVDLAPEVYGEQSKEMASLLNNLAELYRSIGEYARAEPLYQRSLRIREEKLGKDHPAVADSLNNLAVLYKAMGQDGRAKPLYQHSAENQKTPLPRLYVLAVGINAYPDKLRLRCAANDASAVGKAFQQSSKDLYAKVETKVLTDEKATRKGVLDGLSWLRKEMTQRDVAVVFFAGHGAKDNAGSLYLLPADVDPDNLLSSAVPGEQVKKALAALLGRVLFLLDACHAGAAGGDRRRAAEPLTDELVQDLATDDCGVVMMCSAMAREYSLESKKLGHGYFTQALVEGLQGKGARSTEGAVYLHHLDGYVTDRVKELTGGLQHPVTAKPTSIRSFPLSRPSQAAPVPAGAASRED